MGFVTYALHPAASAASMSPFIAFAVTAMITTSSYVESLRSCRANVRPSIPGRLRSSSRHAKCVRASIGAASSTDMALWT
jgi:hypothetical protein